MKFRQKIVVFIVCFYTLCSCETYNQTSKHKEKVENIKGYFLRNIATELGEELRKVTSEELFISNIQVLYNKFKYTNVYKDIESIVQITAHKITEKLNETFHILNETKGLIEDYTKNYSSFLSSYVVPCTNDETKSRTSLQEILRKQKHSAKKYKESLKQIYFLSSYEIRNYTTKDMFNCDKHDQSLLWKLYMNRVRTKPRNIMLLLDHGAALSRHHFDVIKAMAKQMISVLNVDDNIGLISISDDWKAPYLTDQCLMPNQIPPTSDFQHMLSPATDNNKYLLNRFIDSLRKGNGVTNHSLGFEQALNTIKISNLDKNETVMLLYISRGLLSSLTEAKAVLETIKKILEDLDNDVIINTCAVVDGSKPIMYEMHFLREIAEQNYSKYNLEFNGKIHKGIILTVSSNQSVGLAAARFYSVLNSLDLDILDLQVSYPTWDNFSKDVAISVTTSVGAKGELGLLGIDLYFFSIVENITYYSNYYQYTYTFLINKEGNCLMHSLYPRPAVIRHQLKFVDISHLEKSQNFDNVRTLLLTKEEGTFVLKNGNETLKYIWKSVKDLYVVCMVVKENKVPPVRPDKVTWFSSSSTNRLIYHRLDILPGQNLCKHLNQMATFDAGALYLSASCFKSPFEFTHTSSDSLSPLTVQKYMAYLKDSTRLLSSPGLREDIQDDVAALAYILELFRTQHMDGLRYRYIVRRYVTSPSGVLQVFPGGLIPPGLDPTKRVWYLRATDHKYHTVLVPPYLDAGGAGYIVTIAYATSHVVVAMDVTLGYIYKLMLERMPFCVLKNIKCFLMDNYGYLIYHPNLIDPKGHGPIEQQHIIHKESFVANDILNHKHFIRKMSCNNYADGTIQRFYKLNMTLTDVLTNVVHGEHCIKYQVTSVPGTNIFVGVVNVTCEFVTTFCPCSMIDRLCLNCNRMEQKECECPCECPLNLNTCTYHNRSFMNNPMCSVVPEESHSVPLETTNKLTYNLRPCMSVSCEEQSTYETCLGVLGCEWCHTDVDGETPLINPFCTSHTSCFNGILGSATPYGQVTSDAASSSNLLPSSFSPVVPVIGSLIGLALVFALLFFCYRSYNSPLVECFYLSSAQDHQVHMSDFNLSENFHELGNHQDRLLQDTKKPEPISPYCVPTAYRKPLTAADSDHGYSTMTPHDESEHLSFVPVEIDSLEDDCTSDATSVNTSVSCKQAAGSKLDRSKIKPVPEVTDLQMKPTSNKNCVVTQVTVHRNMEPVQ